MTIVGTDDQTLELTYDVEINGGYYSFVADGRSYSVLVGSNGELRTTNTNTLFSPQNDASITFENLTISNTATGGGVMLNLDDAYTGSTMIRHSTFQTQSTSNPIMRFEGSVGRSFKNVTLQNTNSNSTAPLIDVATDTEIFLNEDELVLENAGSGGGIEISGGGLFIKNENITETQGEPIFVLDADGVSLRIVDSTITNLGAGCIIREDIGNDDLITITGSTLTATGANATIGLYGGGTTHITDTSSSNTGSGDVFLLAGTADVTIDGSSSIENTGTGDLISIEGATGDISITGTAGTPIELTANSGFALRTDGSSFGLISLEYTQSNAPIQFNLANASDVGELVFNNNEVDTEQNNNPFRIITAGEFTVSSFQNNTLAGGTSTPPAFAMSGSGDITFSSGFIGNTISTQRVNNEAFFVNIFGSLTIEGEMSGNTFQTFGDGDANAFVLNARTDSTVLLEEGFNNNTIITDGSGADGIILNANDGVFTITGGFSNNNITCAGSVHGIRLVASNTGSLTINGGLTNNTVTTAGDAMAIISNNNGVLTVNDAFHSNTITSTSLTQSAISLDTNNDDGSTIDITVGQGSGSGPSLLISENTLSASSGTLVSEEGTSASITITP